MNPLRITLLALVVLTICSMALAQDPAQGWMGYAMGKHPDNPDAKITRVTMSWINLNNPVVGGAFFSPWFGIEASDNMNLIQPVNPWLGSSWAAYGEYFQWDPVHNENTDQTTVLPGEKLVGSVMYLPDSDSYHLVQSVQREKPWKVEAIIPVQKYANGTSKLFNIIYVVMEKSQWSCDSYPPDDKVTFFDISVEYDNQPVKPTWTTAVVDDHCDCRAHIVNDTVIDITWNSQG